MKNPKLPNNKKNLKINKNDRKAIRQEERKFKKVKNALHASRNTNKICLSQKDIDNVSHVLKDNPSVQKILKEKALSNQTAGLIGKKKKKKKKAPGSENKDICDKTKQINEESQSLNFNNSNDVRLARLQDYVNRESNKDMEKTPNVETNSNSTKKEDKSKKKKSGHDIESEDFAEIGLEDFGALINDIELGNLNNASKYQVPLDSDEEFENDFNEAFSNRNSEISDIKEDFDNNSSDEEIHSSGEENNCSNKENNINPGRKKNKKFSREEASDDSEIPSEDDLFDDEALEDNSCSDNDELMDSEEERLNAMFEGGSCLTNESEPSSSLTVNDIFNIHESNSEDDEDTDLDGFLVDDDVIEYESDASDININLKNNKKKRKRIVTISESSEEGSPLKRNISKLRVINTSEDESSMNLTPLLKSKKKNKKIRNKEKKQVRFQISDDETKDMNLIKSRENNSKSHVDQVSEDLHEDIYGRLVDKSGNVVNGQNPITKLSADAKYIPPHLKKLQEIKLSTEKKEHLQFIERKIKGLLNRLGEGNLQYINNQMEELYSKNSNNDVSESLSKLLIKTIAMPTLTSEKCNRRIQEHALLVSLLSANIGSEVGALILTEFVLKFVEDLDSFTPNINEEVDSKELDNLLLFICYMYSYKVVGVTLIHDIIYKLIDKFEAKHIDLLLAMLSSVGFCLREDNALKLREIIITIQKKSKDKMNEQSDGKFSRIKFMLDILTHLKSNNMKKVPNYDPEVTKHFKSIFKSIVKKGRKASGLNISLEDLIKSKMVGKWWLVGSAWSDVVQTTVVKTKAKKMKLEKSNFNDQFTKKAIKLRLNRPPRVNILYALTEGSTCELEAFNQLLQINLNASEEQEIFNVLLVCNNKYKTFNPAYTKIALLLLNHRKKYRKLLRQSLSSCFSDLHSFKKAELSHFSRFTSNLIAEGAFDLFLMKEFNFVDLSESNRKFLRQTLMNILVHPIGKIAVEKTFTKLANSSDKILRECIRIFMVQYVTPKGDEGSKEKILLAKRIKLALRILASSDNVLL